jgi:hypothetical protein
MLLSHWLHVPALISLGVIVIPVGSAVVVSLVLARSKEPDAAVLEVAGRGDVVKKQDEEE